jgi:hypothetical protein
MEPACRATGTPRFGRWARTDNAGTDDRRGGFLDLCPRPALEERRRQSISLRELTMQNRTIALMLAAGVVAIAAACGSDKSTSTPPVSKIVNFSTALTPAGEIGANLNGNPTGSGTFTATLDTSTNVFSYNVTFTGLTSNVSLGHIHGPFTPGGTANSAGVILNFDPTAAGSAPGATFTGLKSATSGSASGTITLNAATSFSATVNGDSLRKLLLAGLTYANIHTTQNGGGEVRGQIVIVNK